MFTIREAQRSDHEPWLRLRMALWPECPAADHAREMAAYYEGKEGDAAAFVAVTAGGGLCGFAEVGLRKYADGCASSPVGYLEGTFVASEFRRRGVGAALVKAGEEWVKARGCVEFGSDCYLDNAASVAFHRRVGFEVGETLIHFRRRIGSGGD